MRASSRFKSVFLEQMLMGFQLSGFPCRTMSLRARMQAIKLSADVAMAVARGSRRWTHGLIAHLSKKEDNKSFLKCILGKQYERLTMPCYSSWKIQRCKTILRRSFRERFGKQKPAQACTLARSLVKKRAQVLKRLVPGGKAMDGYSLLDETMDYVVCLQAQVDLMRHLLGAFEASKLRAQTKGTSSQGRKSIKDETDGNKKDLIELCMHLSDNA
ncbi:unnamed protein product [Musa acuminata subsp. malaccensis]|uniref:(wild Malaysian banana) hypothetical protein n=1 Tax=Musa acuminata subsp. malaccensis TaxID=214687 RepID=A0A804IBK2_MUSAM|nr:PREDICTED: uncharacterized protein LOC103974367 isoform X2 [Musa acuminata subsp. malaccensis]CAG1850028.1 unnamed protein product [Musa acuminata subsp. malaccensis]